MTNELIENIFISFWLEDVENGEFELSMEFDSSEIEELEKLGITDDYIFWLESEGCYEIYDTIDGERVEFLVNKETFALYTELMPAPVNWGYEC